LVLSSGFTRIIASAAIAITTATASIVQTARRLIATSDCAEGIPGAYSALIEELE
jgi:hypothetical protein